MEADYFVTLVELERAGTPELRKILNIRPKTMAREATQVSQLAEDAERLAQQGRESYYTHWSYAAVHVLTGIPGLQSEARLAETLGVSPHRVGVVLGDLERLQLVERQTQNGKILLCSRPSKARDKWWRARPTNALYSFVSAIVRSYPTFTKLRP